MLVRVVYWLLILLTAAGKVLAFATLVVFTIAMPLTRIRVAWEEHAANFRTVLANNTAVAVFGLVGVYVLLENARIFLQAL